VKKYNLKTPNNINQVLKALPAEIEEITKKLKFKLMKN